MMNAAFADGLTTDDLRHLEAVLARIEAGRAVLFAGAGMSRESGGPDAATLATELRDAFLPSAALGLDLDLFAGILQSTPGIDRVDVDAWIADRLRNLLPSPHHLTIAKFSWPAIFTTNYDRLIEKGYDNQPSAIQQYQAVRHDADEFDIYNPKFVAVFKLMGCISLLQDSSAPLVLSQMDHFYTRQRRQTQLKRLGDMQRANTWLFIGYSFRDRIITDLFLELIEAVGKDRLRWSYAILPGITAEEREYLKQQFNILAINLTASQFFAALEKQTNQFQPPELQTATASGAIERFVHAPTFALFDKQFEILGVRPISEPSPATFYRGNTPTWGDLAHNLDAHRDQTDHIDSAAREFISRALTVEQGKSAAILLTGSAGTGKTAILRRVAFDLFNSLDVTVLVARDGSQWDARSIQTIARELGKPVVVIIDSGEVDFQRVRNSYRFLVDHDVPALFLVAARLGPWSAAERRWGPFNADLTVELNEQLSDTEVNQLINKLAWSGLLELNAISDSAYWMTRARAADRQLLVLLLELVQPGRFDEIILSEYQSLDDTLGEKAYQIVAALHEFGLPTKRELLRRMLDCDWDEFIDRIVRGIARKVIIEDYETASGRAFYRTKHPLIAKVIRVATVGQPLGILRTLIANVDPVDLYDLNTVRNLLRSEYLDEAVADYPDQRQLFNDAVGMFPSDIVIRHQMGIKAMEFGQLEEARIVFETCLTISPNNNAVLHSFGLLEWERAKRVAKGPLRELLYANALRRFRDVTEADKHSEYGYHSSAALWLFRASQEDDSGQRMAFLGNALEMVELGLSEVDRRDAGRLVDIRGQILEQLGLLEEAREEYRISIEDGTGTAFTFRLLARLENEEGHADEALSLVQRGLELFEEDAGLLALRAELLLRRKLSRGEQIAILEPAVRTNPRRLSLRFAYAVALYELGRTRDAEREFNRTRSLSEGIFARGRVRHYFEDASGNRIQFEGRIDRTSRAGGFLRVIRSDNRDAVYFNAEYAFRLGLRQGSAVVFEIGFSYLGPIAFNMGNQ